MVRKVIATLVTEFTGDSSKLKKSTKELEKENKNLEKSNKKVEKSTDKVTASEKKLEREDRSLSRSTRELSRETGKLERKLDSLASTAGRSLPRAFDVLKNKLSGAGDKFSRVNNARSYLFSALAGGGVLAGFKESSSYFDEVAKSAKQLGVDASNLFLFGQAATRAGGSFEGLVDGLENLSERILQAKEGGNEYARAFERLGVDLKSDIPVIYQIAEAFQKLEESEQVGIGQQLSLNRDFIRFLQLGPTQMKSLVDDVRRYGQVTQEQFENAEKQADQWANIRQSIQAIGANVFLSAGKSDFLAGVAEILGKFAENDWTEGLEKGTASSKLLIAGLVAVLTAATLVIGTFLAGLIGLPIAVASALAGIATTLVLFKDEIYAMWSGVPNGRSSDYDVHGNNIHRKNPWIREMLLEQGISPETASEKQLKENYLYLRQAAGVDFLSSSVGSGIMPVASAGNSFANSDNSFSFNNNININTQATDATGIAQSISPAISLELSNVLSDFDTGVK